MSGGVVADQEGQPGEAVAGCDPTVTLIDVHRRRCDGREDEIAATAARIRHVVANAVDGRRAA